MTRGDVYNEPFAAVEDAIDVNDNGGRYVKDLVINSSSTTATSATAAFSTNDTGKKIVTADGVGITDGTTMTYVSPTQVTLSAVATATRTNVLAFLRPLNTTGYTTHLAQVRRGPDATGVPLATFTVDATRAGVGVYWLSLTPTDTAKFPPLCAWDWQATSSAGPSTWMGGPVHVTKDVSK